MEGRLGGEGGDVEAEGELESTEHDSGGVVFRGELESIEEMEARGREVEDDGVEEQGAESIEEICVEEQGEVECEESMLESTSQRCYRAHDLHQSLFGESSWPGSRLPGSGRRSPGMALR